MFPDMAEGFLRVLPADFKTEVILDHPVCSVSSQGSLRVNEEGCSDVM